MLLTSAFLYSLGLAYCPEPNSFCVSLSQVNAKNCYTVHSRFDGWTGFGIGSREMRGADMYIGWRNSTGGVTIVNALAPGNQEPTVQGLVPSLAVLERPPAFARMSFSFCRTPLETEEYIYAGDSRGPSGLVDTRSARISFHNGMHGGFSADLVSGTGTGRRAFLKPTGTLRDIYAIHGIMMYVAWCVCPFLGIFIAKFMKSRLGPNWFRLHVLLMGFGTGMVSLASFILVILFRPPPHFFGDSALESTHTLMGLIITVLMIGQVILGFIIDKLFDSERQTIPVRDKVHWYLGRLLSMAAIANAWIGLTLFDNMYTVSIGLKVGFWVVVTLGFLLFAYGETLAADHHVKDASSTDALVH
jgi:F0F1-type ATP synthase assembly protein I